MTEFVEEVATSNQFSTIVERASVDEENSSATGEDTNKVTDKNRQFKSDIFIIEDKTATGNAWVLSNKLNSDKFTIGGMIKSITER